jgi:hypothetical protein
MVSIKYHSVSSHYGETRLGCIVQDKKTILIAITDDAKTFNDHYQSVSLDVDTAIKLQKHLKRLIAEIKGANNV